MLTNKCYIPVNVTIVSEYIVSDNTGLKGY